MRRPFIDGIKNTVNIYFSLFPHRREMQKLQKRVEMLEQLVYEMQPFPRPIFKIWLKEMRENWEEIKYDNPSR